MSSLSIAYGRGLDMSPRKSSTSLGIPKSGIEAPLAYIAVTFLNRLIALILLCSLLRSCLAIYTSSFKITVRQAVLGWLDC